MHVSGTVIPCCVSVATDWGTSASNECVRDYDGQFGLSAMLRRAEQLSSRNHQEMQAPVMLDQEVSCALRPLPALTAFAKGTKVTVYAHKEVSCMLLEQPALQKFEPGTRARIYHLNDLHQQMRADKSWASLFSEPKDVEGWNGCFVCFDQPH